MRADFENIVFVIPSLGSGGAERVVSILANEMAARGKKVSIVLTANGNVCYNLSDAVVVVSLECENRHGTTNALKRYFSRIRDIRKAVRACAPDVVVSFMSETNMDVCFATMGLRVPIIVSERNDPLIDPKSRIKQWLRKVAYCRANGFVFQTPDAQAYFNRRIQKKSCIIYNPLTTQMPPPYTGERDKRIVAVGRLNKQKNYPLLLDAFCDFRNLNPDYILEIYGEGPLQDEICRMIEEKGLTQSVFLKGFCQNIHEKIREAAFYVMTSDFEGMPNALVEALALGLPCISTDCRCGGPRLLIQHKKNGLLVPTGEKEPLLQAMLDMAQDPSSSQAMGFEASNVKNLVDAQRIVEQWISYIDKCLHF